MESPKAFNYIISVPGTKKVTLYRKNGEQFNKLTVAVATRTSPRKIHVTKLRLLSR